MKNTKKLQIHMMAWLVIGQVAIVKGQVFEVASARINQSSDRPRISIQPESGRDFNTHVDDKIP